MPPTAPTLLPLHGSGWLMLLLGMLAILTPVAAWLMSALLVGPSRGSRWRRAGAPFFTVAVCTVAFVGLLRLLGGTNGAPGGPQGWLAACNLALAQAQTGFWSGLAGAAHALAGANGTSMPTGPIQIDVLPRDLLFPLAALCGLFTIVTTFVAALVERGRKEAPDYLVPHGGWVALVVSLCAVVGLFQLAGTYAVSGERVALDLAAALPTALVCLALWALSGRTTPPAKAKVEDAAAAPSAERHDIVEQWKLVGAVGTADRSVFASAARHAAGGSREAREAWRAVGAAGPPPLSLDQLIQKLTTPGEAWMIGDLPDPTESLLLASLVLVAAQERGLPCLIVTESPAALRDQVSAALRRVGAWRYGPLVVGEDDLRIKLENGQMPAAAFVDLAGLSSRAIRALWNCLTPPATAWTRTIGLVVVSRIDRGTPLEASHRFFALRRLALVLSAGGARYSVLATGLGGPGTMQFVQRVFTRARVSEVPFAPRASAPVKVWAVTAPFAAHQGAPWPKRAAEPLVNNLQLRVSVADPTGRYDSGVAIWGGDMPVLRDLTFEGNASVAVLDDAWFVAAWRALRNRVPLADGSTHHSLWSWESSPITMYLAEDDNIRKLEHAGQLITPRSLVGAENPHVARAHLEAALREGRQDRESLEGYFGRSLTDDVLKTVGDTQGHALRRIPSGDDLVRVTTVPSQMGTLDDVLRETVTGDFIVIKSRDGGRALARCDRALIETRFYPGRVFATRDARYEVRQKTLDLQRGELLVDGVESDRPTTRPDISVHMRVVDCTDPPQKVVEEHRAYTLATYEVEVAEEILRFYHQDGTKVEYGAPVGARYRTQVRGIFFPRATAPEALHHLAACLDRMLLAHLLASDDDIHVIAVPAGFAADQPAGVVAIDRYVGGMGVAKALDLPVVKDLFRWVRSTLYNCNCRLGCPRCTPTHALRGTLAKTEVLKLLGA